MKIQIILAKDANITKIVKTLQIDNIKDDAEVRELVKGLKSVYGARFANWYRI